MKSHFLSILVYFLALLSLCLFPQYPKAHSEAEKARFVSQNGQDTGFCNNRFRPCKTIAYAAQQANKGDKILVAGGTYQLSSAEELLYLISDMQPVYGGFSIIDNYQVQAPDKFVTSISGVPVQYALSLSNKGFVVIADQKGNSNQQLTNNSEKTSVDASVDKLLSSLQSMQSSQTASDCIDGEAAGFECRNISLLAHLPLSVLPTSSGAANDIWGHVDLNTMREYAIIGLQRGLAVVDVSEPENPVIVDAIEGQTTTWRDIKVYQYYDAARQRFQAYAYSGGDSISEGLSIIDLSDLPNSIKLVARTNDDVSSHNVYISGLNYTSNISLNSQTPILHVVGSPNFGGAWRSFNLSDPEQPSVGYRNTNASRADYTHDASSLMIDDARASSDCMLPSGQTCNVILDFNEQEVRLWALNNEQQASELSQATYPNLEYVHSGWWSEDKNYIFVHDELDERNRVINTSLNVFDISDLRSPQLVATWVGPTRAVDHNGFVKGNKYYMSNYERGVTILDISDPTAPREIGYFDTFGPSNNAAFNGVWGVYPYLPSGIIIASDIQGGLYVLRDDTLRDTDNALGFAETLIQAQEGSTINIEVIKQGSLAQTVGYQILYPSATAEDIAASSGTLSWTANDSQSQFISIDVLADTRDESDEMFIVVLNNAENGDIINAKSNAFVTIAGSLINSGRASFEQDRAQVLETQGMLEVRVNRVGGSAGTLQVSLSLVSGTAENDLDFVIDSALSQLNWEDGDTASRTISISIVDDTLNESAEDFTLRLGADDTSLIGATQDINIVIRDDDSNQAPVVNAGTNRQVNTRQTVRLNGASVSDDSDDFALQWTQLDGPSVAITNATSLTPSFVAPPSAGSITLQLSATDVFGAVTNDSVLVTIVAPTVVTNPSANSGGGGSLSLLFLLGIFVVAFYRSGLHTGLNNGLLSAHNNRHI